MATSGDGRALYKSSKRPFQSEIDEEPPSVSQEAGRNNSSGVSEHITHQGGNSSASRISKLEQILKPMSFTRSETEHLIALLHSRTIVESPSYNFGASMSSSRVAKEQIIGLSPALIQDSKSINNNAICLPKTPFITSPQHPTTIENLPSEILSIIFTLLFAKQLARMRSVSKSWNALLSEPSFIKSHLQRSIKYKNNPLLHFSKDYSRGFETYIINPNLQLTNSIKFPQPDSDLSVIGSANGLICSSYRSDSVIHIWNPSLSRVLTLPPYSMPPYSRHRGGYEWIKVFFRFGFDPETDDYKVVKLTSFTDCEDSVVLWWMDVEVYSMRKGSWELIAERFPSHITWIDEHEVVCIDGPNGNLHWLGCTNEDSDATTIVAFDLGSEEFHEMPLPHSIVVTKYHRFKSLGVLAGKLCVMVWGWIENDACEVWVMMEYGVAESWAKCNAFPCFTGDKYPFGFTSANKFLIQDRNRLLLCNPVRKQAIILKNDFSYEEYNAGKFVEYVDSLVWVTPGDHEKVNVS